MSLFFPERMKFLWFVSSSDEAEEMIALIGKAEALHVVDISDKLYSRYRGTEVPPDLISSIERIFAIVGARPKLSVELLRFDESIIEKAEFFKDELLPKLEELNDRMGQLQRSARLMEEISFVLDLLKSELGIDGLNRFLNIRKFRWKIGVLPAVSLPSLLDNESVFAVEIGRENSNRYVLIFYPPDYEPFSFLSSLGWQDVEIIPRDELTREVLQENLSYEGLSNRLAEQSWELMEEVADLKQRMVSLYEEYSEELAAVYLQLKVLSRAVEIARSKAASSEHFVVVAGWVPVSRIKKLSDVFDRYAWGTDEEVEIVPPTYMNPPSPFKPFASVVSTYGLPEYNSFDPTLIVSITFPLLFGMMFGDVGHGLVLSIGGLFLWLRGVTYAGVFFYSGLSAMLFGFLYGSFFCYEDVIPPLLFSPSPLRGSGYLKLMAFSIFLGMAIIVLGMIINVIQHIKKPRKAIFGEHGLLSLFFYLSVILAGLWGLIFKSKVPVYVVALPFVLLVLMFLRPLLEGEKMTIDNVFMAFEEILNFFTNTVSFVRVAAFAMSHAIMSSLVFIFREAFGSGGTGFGLDILLGNIFVMAMEGLVVYIQTVRLHYYEFFSKFFSGKGYPYSPLKWELK